MDARQNVIVTCPAASARLRRPRANVHRRRRKRPSAPTGAPNGTSVPSRNSAPPCKLSSACMANSVPPPLRQMCTLVIKSSLAKFTNHPLNGFPFSTGTSLANFLPGAIGIWPRHWRGCHLVGKQSSRPFQKASRSPQASPRSPSRHARNSAAAPARRSTRTRS